MPQTTSRDGTTIAYSKQGNGPALVFVDGAWCYREFGPSAKLEPLLAEHFTFVSYDRRGRGESGDTRPYDVQREIEDVQAVVDAVGGHAVLFGISSGAVLAMRAAAAGVRTDALVMYEAPLAMSDAPGKQQPERIDEIIHMVEDGRRSDAVAAFMQMVGMPGFAVPIMKLMRGTWSKLEGVAHTVPYDFAVIAHASASKPLAPELEQAARNVRAPALLMDGGKAAPWMRHAQDRLAALMPSAERRTLPKQSHNVNAKVIAPAITEFVRRPAVVVPHAR